jgi:hypothetical protein
MKKITAAIASDYILSRCSDSLIILLGGTDSEQDFTFLNKLEEKHDLSFKYGAFTFYRFPKEIIAQYFDDLISGDIFEFYIFSDAVSIIEDAFCDTFEKYGVQKGCTVCLHNSVVQKLNQFLIFLDGDLLISKHK